MKRILNILFIMLFSLSFFAQNPNDALLISSSGATSLKEIKAKPKKTKGSYYYMKTWNVGTIELFSGEVIENYPLKYDMKMNQIDIKVDNEVKVLSTGAIKEIVWVKSNGTTEVLRNSILYNKNEHGLFSIINDGKTPLLKKTSLKLQEANYNSAMDVGSRAKKYIKIKTYYTVLNGDIKRIKNSKRKINKLFNDKAVIVKQYVEENNLSYKNDYDLAKIFKYYNSL